MMAKEYIEREAALNELEEELEYDTPFYTEEQNKFISSGLRIAVKDIKRLPAADVVEVVRCKDCKHLEIDKGWQGGRACLMRGGDTGWCHDNDFCSYGERKTD